MSEKTTMRMRIFLLLFFAVWFLAASPVWYVQAQSIERRISNVESFQAAATEIHARNSQAIVDNRTAVEKLNVTLSDLRSGQATMAAQIATLNGMMWLVLSGLFGLIGKQFYDLARPVSARHK